MVSGLELLIIGFDKSERGLRFSIRVLSDSEERFHCDVRLERERDVSRKIICFIRDVEY